MELTPYQTDHLFMLIGTNPLPNYVAASLLAKPDGTIYLLHSGGTQGTGKTADNLKAVIEKVRPDLSVILREIDEVNSDRIVKSMEEMLGSIGDQSSIGLHYTGGTKAMSVHSYRAVERCFPSAVFSYLDARTLSIVIDGAYGSLTKMIPVGLACEIKLQNLVSLHGRQTQEPSRETQLPDVYRALVNLHAQDPKPWRQWCDRNLRRSDRRDKFKSKTDLKMVKLPDEPDLASVFVSFPGSHTLDKIPLPPGWKMGDLVKWLDGTWLEHYVLDCVKQVAASCYLHDWGMNLEPVFGQQKFEFDVAAMRGYQLFALSCTTSDEKWLCKSKLFEAYVRAQQMGGEEARVGLVCCYKNTIAIQREVEEEWFAVGRIKVFGICDLPDLPAHLKHWFETANLAN